MSDISWHEDATKTVRILQIIVGAMFAGVLFFLVIVLNIAPLVKPPAPLLPISVTLIAFALVGVGLIARAVVLWNITTKGRREITNGTYQSVNPRQRIRSLPSDVADKPLDPCRDAKYFLSVFHYRTMVSAALFEGWAFFATIAYLIEGDRVSLGLAVLLVLGVAAHFPTRSRAIGWVERQMETLEQEKVMR